MKYFLFFVFVVSTLSFVSAQNYTAGVVALDSNFNVDTVLNSNVLFDFGVNPQSASSTITKNDSIICMGTVCNITVNFNDPNEIYPTLQTKNGFNQTSLAFAVGHPYFGTAIGIILPFQYNLTSVSVIFYTNGVEKAHFPATTVPSTIGLSGFGAYGNAPGQLLNGASLVWVVNATSPIPTSSTITTAATSPTSSTPPIPTSTSPIAHSSANSQSNFVSTGNKSQKVVQWLEILLYLFIFSNFAN